MWNKLGNKTGNVPHYLTCRNGVFYACFRLPTVLSKRPKVIRRSLHTRDAGLARMRLAQWLPTFHQIRELAQVKSQKEQLEDLVPSIRRLNELTSEDERDVAKVVDELNAPYVAEYPEALFFDNTDAIENSIGPYLKEKLTVLESIETEDDAERVLAEYPLSGVDIAASEREAYRDELLYLRARLAKLQGDSALYDLMRSQLMDRYLTPELTAYREQERDKETQDKVLADVARQSIMGGVSALPVTTKASSNQTPSLLLSESYANFLKFKKDLTPKITKDYDRFIDFTIVMLGDIETKQITKQKLRECLKIYRQMPKGNQSPYNKMSMSEKVDLAKACEIDNDQMIKGKTAGELLKFYQSLFSAYLTDDQEVFTASPTNGLKKPPSDNVTWGAYDKPQGRQIYDYWLAQPDSPMRWIFLLVLFTGMRRSEIAKITRTSLKKDDTGRYYLWIEEGKTTAATRSVTIAKELQALGFVKYLQLLDGTLYPENRLNDITETVTKVRKLLNIGECDDKGYRLVFHSFRHSFVTFKQVKEGVDYQRLQRFVGHEGARSITQRYTHGHMIPDYSDIADGAWWA